MSRPKISALILSYNNEKEIARCIKSLSWADEVVVIDSFSSDNTARLARELGASVYQYPFSTFGTLRNLALSHASYEWVFSLDTDEVATKSVVDEILKIAQNENASDVYFVPRLNTVFGRKLRHGGWYPDYRQPQFFKKTALVYNEHDDVHEGFKILGSKSYLKNHIEQFPFDNLNHYLKKMERYSSLMAKRMLKEKKSFSPIQLITRPAFAFFKRYFLRRGFLDGFHGFLMAKLYSYYTFQKYAKFWELKSQQNTSLK